VTGDCHAPFWGSPGVTPPGHPTLPAMVTRLGLLTFRRSPTSGTTMARGAHRGHCNRHRRVPWCDQGDRDGPHARARAGNLATGFPSGWVRPPPTDRRCAVTISVNEQVAGRKVTVRAAA
jgi:hypothetical protein